VLKHHLSVLPDIPESLAKLKMVPYMVAAIFTYETDAMASAPLLKSLSSYAHLFKHIFTVEEIRRYKPASEVYEMLARKVGIGKEEVRKIWLVGENPVDVVEVQAVGVVAFHVGRGAGERRRPELTRSG
jgi:2-haloacid dehalogenase